MLNLLGGLQSTDCKYNERLIHQKYKAYVVGLLLALLSTTTEAENEVKGRFLLDVVVVKSATILKLLASKDQALLIRWNSR